MQLRNHTYLSNNITCSSLSRWSGYLAVSSEANRQPLLTHDKHYPTRIIDMSINESILPDSHAVPCQRSHHIRSLACKPLSFFIHVFILRFLQQTFPPELPSLHAIKWSIVKTFRLVESTLIVAFSLRELSRPFDHCIICRLS